MGPPDVKTIFMYAPYSPPLKRIVPAVLVIEVPGAKFVISLPHLTHVPCVPKSSSSALPASFTGSQKPAVFLYLYKLIFAGVEPTLVITTSDLPNDSGAAAIHPYKTSKPPFETLLPSLLIANAFALSWSLSLSPVEHAAPPEQSVHGLELPAKIFPFHSIALASPKSLPDESSCLIMTL